MHTASQQAFLPSDDESLLQSYLRIRSASESLVTTALALPAAVHDMHRVGFFHGSAIGNFTPEEAVRFLRGARRLLGENAMLIIGADVEHLAFYPDRVDLISLTV